MPATEPSRPVFVTDAMLEYLDEIRASARTNMFGAAPYLVSRFGLDRQMAKDALLYWMETFDQRHPQGDPNA